MVILEDWSGIVQCLNIFVYAIDLIINIKQMGGLKIKSNEILFQYFVIVLM